jgi:hypothetical protein
MLSTAPIMALEKKEEVLMAGQFSLLAADVAMISYDPENADYLVQARTTFSEVVGVLPSWLADLPPEQQNTAQNDWASYVELLQGEGDYPGLLEGYDLNLDANQRVHYDSLQSVLTASPQLQSAVLSDIEKLYLRITSVVAGYVSLTANPFGSMAMSANDLDSRVVTLSAEIDQLFTAAIQGTSDPMVKQTLRRQRAKWQFIRGTVVQGSQSAMPYIVRFQGKQIADEIGLLIEG